MAYWYWYWFWLWHEAPRRETDFLENFGKSEYYRVRAEHEAELNRDVEVSSTTLASGQYLPGTRFKLRTVAQLIEQSITYSVTTLYGLTDPKQYKLDPLPLTGLTFTNRDVARWNMAWRAVQTCNLVENTAEDGVTQIERPGVEHLPRLLTKRCHDWPTFVDLASLPVLLGFSVAAFMYGGLHALAWFAHFNSNTEQLLWRASACIVMSGFPVACISRNLMIDVFKISLRPRKVWKNRAIRKVYQIVFLCLWLLFFLVSLAYILARAYLVVECLINLSHLPVRAYDVPKWSAYFPHIS